MKLTTTEYRQGIVHWDIPDAILCVTSAQSQQDREQWSEGIVVNSGSIAPVPARPVRRVAVVPKSKVAPLPPFQIRWEFLDGDDVSTAIWKDSLLRPCIVLKRVPNFGTFHRLVVSTPLLVWAEDQVFRSGDAIIRMGRDSALGESFGTENQIAIESGKLAYTTDWMGTNRHSGPFIEITAPGSSPEIAETNAYAFLGFLGVCLGDHAIGEIVFSEAYQAIEEEQATRIGIPTFGRAPWPKTDDELDAVTNGFEGASNAIQTVNPLAIALRWYEKGVRSDTALDKLIAFFIGIEAIISRHAAAHAPLPVTVERQERHRTLLAEIEKTASPDDYNRIKERLLQPTLMDYFNFYASSKDLPNELRTHFREIRDKRNDVLHGSTLLDDHQLSEHAAHILITLLRRELRLPENLQWDNATSVPSMSMVYRPAGAQVGKNEDEADD